MNQYVDNILQAFDQLESDPQQLQRIQTLAPELSWVEEQDIDQMLVTLSEMAAGIPANMLDRGLEILVHQLSRQDPEVMGDSGQANDDPRRINAVSQLYVNLPADARARNYLLGWLAKIVEKKLCLRTFAIMLNL